jgi:outer membrane protein assembly factor BamA
VNQKEKYKIRKFLLVILTAIFFYGCNTTRYVPEDKYLMSNIDYKIDNRQINKEELSSYVRQEENLKILGFIKFHLWLYNLSKKDKQKSWLREIGEPPAIYDEVLINKSTSQIQQYLFNKGYYQAKVTDKAELKNKKARVTYFIETGNPYLIRNIRFDINDSRINEYIMESENESLIKSGDILDVDILYQERSRITRVLNNKGFFKFEDEYIHFKIDSTFFPIQAADIDIIIDNPRLNSDPTKEIAHKQFYIEDYSINIFTPQKGVSSVDFKDFSDTTSIAGYTYLHKGLIPLKVKAISKTIEMSPGDLYSKAKEERTQNNLYSIRQFKFVNIQFNDDQAKGDSLNGWLRGKIFLPIQVKQNYSFDIEGTNTSDIEGTNTSNNEGSKTSANLGIAGNLNYQHRNLFRGGEIFDITFRGATERQIAEINGKKTPFIMNELGTVVKLSLPGFLLPVNEKKFDLYSMPFTTFSLAYNFQERLFYTRSIVNATFGYQWKSSANFSHSLNLIDLNSVKIYSFDSTFINSIKNLYIKSSYTDHIISATSYSLIYNNQDIKKRPDYQYFRMNLEIAGNTLWVLSSLTGQEKIKLQDPGSENNTTYYQLFNTRFAQYVKGDFEYRYGNRFDKYNSLATRAFFGIAIPYGNFNVTPFEKRYYTGGANGVRAWQVRTLGPGRYPGGSINDPNQSADIKMEANIEYRFKLLWILEGALFVDAGNVWAINQNDNREGAVFKFDKFYDEFAIGTGFGLRLVTNYFIVRTDLGLKLRDPALLSVEPGRAWIPGNRKFEISDLNLNIAIGYPF